MEQKPCGIPPILLSFLIKEGFLNPKCSLFVHHCLKEYNLFTFILRYLRGYMIGLVTATQLLPTIFFINLIQKQIFFSPDIQVCARSNFSKNRNEHTRFPLLSVNHWQKNPRSSYSSAKLHHFYGLCVKNWSFFFILICIHWHSQLEYQGTEYFSSLVCCMFLSIRNI